MLKLTFLAAAILTLAACAQNEDRIAFDGQFYRAKAAKIDDDLSSFTVTVSPASASLEGARQAGAYEATRYCIDVDGTSRIDWTVGPDTDPTALVLDGDTLVFQGRCDP